MVKYIKIPKGIRINVQLSLLSVPGQSMSASMFDEIMKELSSLISENDLHVSQVRVSFHFVFFHF